MCVCVFSCFCFAVWIDGFQLDFNLCVCVCVNLYVFVCACVYCVGDYPQYMWGDDMWVSPIVHAIDKDASKGLLAFFLFFHF